MRKKDNNSHRGRIGDEFQPSGSIVSNEIIRSSDVLTVVIISTWPRMTASPTCCFPTWLECCMSVLQTKSNVVICCFNRLVCCFWAPDLIYTHIGWKYRKSPAVPLGWCFCFIVTDPVNTALLMCAALSLFDKSKPSEWHYPNRSPSVYVWTPRRIAVTADIQRFWMR